MVDRIESGSLYRANELKNLRTDYVEGTDDQGHKVRTINDGIADVSRLQLVHQYVLGEGSGYFMLNTDTNKKIELNSRDELRDAAKKLGVRLDLHSIFDVYLQYRYTWFDVLCWGLLFLPPWIAFVLVIRHLIYLRICGLATM